MTKFVTGGLGPKKISTFGPSDASRKKTIKFHLMRDIAFYSPCVFLLNRLWHEQIVSCMMVIDPNNFKCHGTIFTIFWHQKTHYTPVYIDDLCTYLDKLLQGKHKYSRGLRQILTCHLHDFTRTTPRMKWTHVTMGRPKEQCMSLKITQLMLLKFMEYENVNQREISVKT